MLAQAGCHCCIRRAYVEQVGFDIFGRMAARGLHYAYAVMNRDYPSKTLGLWDFAADYVETHFDRQQRARLDANGFWGNHSFAAPMKESFPMVYNEFEVRLVPRGRLRAQSCKSLLVLLIFGGNGSRCLHRWAVERSTWFPVKTAIPRSTGGNAA